jgi:hypothetical protein
MSLVRTQTFTPKREREIKKKGHLMTACWVVMIMA